jgi:hypothetical protein
MLAQLRVLIVLRDLSIKGLKGHGAGETDAVGLDKRSNRVTYLD